MAITYNNLYMDIRQALNKAGLEGATLEAKELVCFASGKTKEELLSGGHLYVPTEIETYARSLLDRHLQGEPVAYIIGEWEFYGLPFDVSKDVLIPRVDTEVLCEAAIAQIKDAGEVRVLDLCSGSGCIGIAIAHHCPNARVVLGEINEDALRISRQNIRRNNLQGKVIPYQVDALEKPPTHFGEFDFIVCNPPYIPTQDCETLDVSVKDYEPRSALDGGEDGLDFYRSVTEKWTNCMHAGTKLFFEIGIGQADDVMRMMRHVGFGDIEVLQDTGGISRVLYGNLYESI